MKKDVSKAVEIKSDFHIDRQKSSLDPHDWDAFKKLAYRMIDDMIEHFKTMEMEPAWREMPASSIRSLQEPLPLNPSDYEAIYETFKKNILPYSVGNTHPRFWGWVMGSGIPFAMLSDMLVSGMNTNVLGYNQSAVVIEEQVIAWFCEIMGFPKEASGVLVSGGSIANHIGVEVALDAKADFDVREIGLQHMVKEMTIYCSTETHSWIDKTAVHLGVGRHAIRKIPVNDRFMIDTTLLEDTIVKDKQSGLKPFCVIGTVGTVNTGAIDDLKALSNICRKHNLWFHIDGAFGSLVALSTTYKHLASGQELADSMAFDFHKWMHLPFGDGCVLVRDSQAHRKTFSVNPSYLASTSRGIATDSAKMSGLGLELSRRFNALVVWMALKAFGANTFGESIAKNITQANYLQKLIERHSGFELLAPVSLNIVCFRFHSKRFDEESLNQINKELVLRIQESGVAVPSGTLIKGKFSIRVAIVNHRSQDQDFDLFIAKLLQLAQQLLIEFKPKEKNSTDTQDRSSFRFLGKERLPNGSINPMEKKEATNFVAKSKL